MASTDLLSTITLLHNWKGEVSYEHHTIRCFARSWSAGFFYCSLGHSIEFLILLFYFSTLRHFFLIFNVTLLNWTCIAKYGSSALYYRLVLLHVVIPSCYP